MMKLIPRSLAFGLSMTAFIAAFSLIYTTRNAAAMSHPITMEAAAVVSPGDTLTLRGKQRFNRGRMNNLSFYVGSEQVNPEGVDASTLHLVVPELPPGLHAVRVVKHDRSPGRDIVEFYRDVEVGGERVLSSVSGTVSPGGGRVQLPDVARIDLLEDGSRPSVTFTLEHASSPALKKYFIDYLRDGVGILDVDLPPVAAENFVRIKASETFPGAMGLKMKVPAEVLNSMTSEFEPEMYAEFVHSGADDEAFTEVVGLLAEFNPETGEVSAPLPNKYFTPAEETAAAQTARASLASAAAAPLRVEAVIRVSLRRTRTDRDLTVKGTLTMPDKLAMEATARETLNLAGKFNTVVPRVLQNPTIYDPFVVTSPFGPNHGGTDLRTRDGDAVMAAADGEVTAVAFDPFRPGRVNRLGQPQSGGFYIRIRHDDGNVTGYLHLIENSNLVRVGARVTAGQQIARGDSTGGVSGPHLHLNYTVDGARTNAVPFLRAGTPQEYYSQLSLIASIDGTPIQATRRQITASRDFEYAAPLDLSLLNLQPGKTYPFTINVVNAEDNHVPLYRGTLKIKTTALRVVLTWDKADTDVDLHVQDSKGNHAWYGDLTGIPNGVLDHDDVDGFGPETFTLEQMEKDVTYNVFIHYYSDHGNGPTNAKVVVYLDGKEVTNSSALVVNNSNTVIGTYPQPSPPTPAPQQLNRLMNDGSSAGRSSESNQPVTVPLVPTSEPGVFEYTLPNQPGVKLYLHLVPKNGPKPE
jgi:murein DD-endopeptidase MepM/ murein hydrolase activator NlpD